MMGVLVRKLELRYPKPKYVVADVNRSKENSTLLFTPHGDGRVEIYVNWLISVPVNSPNGSQTQARAKLKFNFADDSAYRPADLVLEIK